MKTEYSPEFRRFPLNASRFGDDHLGDEPVPRRIVNTWTLIIALTAGRQRAAAISRDKAARVALGEEEDDA